MTGSRSTVQSPVAWDRQNLTRAGMRARLDDDGPLYDLTAGELAEALVDADVNFGESPLSLRRHQAAGDCDGTAGDGTDDTDAVAQAVASVGAGTLLDGQGRSYRVSSVLPASPVPVGTHLFNGEFVADEMVTTQDEYSVTIFGFKAALANTYVPEQHAASGGRFFASGNHLVAVGREALKANTTGRRNTAIGSRSMLGNTTGFYNTGIGSHTLEVCTTGDSNTCVGVQSLQRVVNAQGNSMLGIGAGLGLTSGSFNTGIGYGAVGGVNGGATVSTGNYNAGGGYRALYSLTTGGDNAAWGRDAAVSLTEGGANTAIGASTLTYVTTQNNNTAIGNNALRTCESSGNTAVGAESADAISTGFGIAVVGFQAATAATTAEYLSAVGYRALAGVTTGNNNTGVGREAGATITTGTGNVCVGYGADVSAGGAANQNSIGYNAACTGDDQVTLGNAGITALRCQVTTITALSDARDKAHIRDLPVGLDFINAVKVRSFRWAMRDGARRTEVPEAGVIAQELLDVQRAFNADWLGLVDTRNPERLEATPGKLLFPLIKAVQELSARVAVLEARLGFST